MQYELFYLVGASKESELESIKSEVEKIVIEEGGKFLEKTTVEKRRLSYIVKHETHGIYIARRFELEKAETLQEINNKINLHTGVLRFIISKASDLPELKSKEERIEDMNKKESASRAKKEEKKSAEDKEVAPVKEKKVEEKIEEKVTEKKEEKNDDIDKKLEEILNI